MDDFFEDAKEAVENITEQSDKRSPLKYILGLIIVSVFLMSLVPVYSIAANPPPDYDAASDFSLTDTEKASLEGVTFGGSASLKSIEQVDVKDYRMIASRLVGEACSKHSDLCYAKAIFAYVSGFNYVSDPSVQYVQSPAETILSRTGDCEDVSLALAAMLEGIGIDADVGLTSDHAFVRAQVDSAPFWISHDGYVWLDATGSEFGKTGFRAADVEYWVEVA